MLDLKRTLQLIQGSLFDSEETWRGYLAEAEDWKKTAVLLTVPLVVFSSVIAYVVAFAGSDNSLMRLFRPTILSTAVNICIGIIAAGVIAFIVSALAGVFGGKKSFSLGLAATSLAFVPGYVGQAVAWLPWIGGLIALGLFIYSLVLLWRIIPMYLNVPESKRAGHYIISLLATVVTMFILGGVFGGYLYGNTPLATSGRVADSGVSGSGTGGMFGGVVRQAELVAAAEEDRYKAPSDGELSERQVEEFIRVMQRAKKLAAEKQNRLRELSERADQNEDVSFSDLTEMMSGVTEIAGLNTLEIEIVKSGGGNWAEHQWVRESLRTAYVQQDINDAVSHNYRLYRKYEDQLAEFVAR